MRLRLRPPVKRTPTPADEPWRVSSGWIRAVAIGLDAEALELLRDYLATWSVSAGYDPELAKRFLEQMLAELLEAPEAPEEVAVHCEASCWVAGELLALGVEPVMERWLYAFVTRTPMLLVPADSLHWAFQYASEHDLSPPWLDGDHAPQ